MHPLPKLETKRILIQASLASRLWRYQAERFPLAATLPMVAAFSASAAGYSRVAASRSGFVAWDAYAVGGLTALGCFFMLRVLDEHKDAAQDARYRKELPVPRGLVSLKELRGLGLAVCIIALALNAWRLPRALPLLAAVAVWAWLMTREFFVPAWLRARPLAYMLSHMAIMPLIDAYASGMDWSDAGSWPPHKLGLFLSVTFCNGMIIETGRKLKSPSHEREGVDTYSSAWGPRRAAWFWLGSLGLTLALALLAGAAVGMGPLQGALLGLLAAACAAPALAYLRRPEGPWGGRVEAVSGIWTIAMYLWLGLWPLLGRGH